MGKLTLKFLGKGYLSRTPCIGQEGALRTTFPLLLTVSFPLSHLVTAGKLQALTMGSTIAALDMFVNLRVLLSVVSQLLLLRSQPSLPKTVAASPDESALQFEILFLA